MKIFIKFATIVVTLSLILSAFVFPASAAKSAAIIFSKSTVQVGDKVTVSVSVNPGEEMYAVSFYLEYNDEVLKYEGGSGVANAGVLKVVESPSGEKSVRYNFTFSAKQVGSSTFTVTDCVYDILGDNGAETKKFDGASAKMTIKDIELSANAKLKSLKVNGYKLSPSFSSSKTSYTLKVPKNVTKINVTATPEHKNAKVVSVTGNSNLKIGDNKVTVTVEAENGTQKKYTINVTRLEVDETDVDEEEETTPESALQTTVGKHTYTIITKLPETVIFKGYEIETAEVNGYQIETAVDKEGFYRIFYLQAPESEKLIPFLYDEETEEFEPVKYIVFNNTFYIFSEIPDDFPKPDTLYNSSIEINTFTIPCLSDTNGEMSEFHYVYAYANGAYNLYRYDSFEGTLQRQPDFEFITIANIDKTDNFFTRFSSLSSNAKTILIGLVIVVLGVLALLILLIVYLFRKSVINNDDVILSMNDGYFDEIDIEKDERNLK